MEIHQMKIKAIVTPIGFAFGFDKLYQSFQGFDLFIVVNFDKVFTDLQIRRNNQEK
jgi:hypothetical protein